MAFAKNLYGARPPALTRPRAAHGPTAAGNPFGTYSAAAPAPLQTGFDGSAATDAYRRYEEDIACAAQMGLGAYRFSVSWARVDPYGDGRWNGEGFAFYLRMLQACRAAGLEPYVTLYHWELPQALEDAGGWRSRETARAFARYAAEAARRFSGLAENYITLNEPECTVKLGHGTGVHAPGLRLPEARQLLVLHHQLLAHGLAAAAIRETCPGVRVGIAATGRLCWPGTDSPADVEAACSATFATPDSDWAFTYQMVLDPVCFGHYPENCGPGLRRMTGGAPSGRPGGHPHTAGFYWLEHLQWPRGMCRDGKAAGLCAAPARLCCDSAEMARYAAGDELGRAFSLAEVRPADLHHRKRAELQRPHLSGRLCP